MSTSAHTPRGSVSDVLMLQVNADNIIVVYQQMDDHLRQMQAGRRVRGNLRNVPACADDPVSLDAVVVFQPKINSLVDVHERYVDEVRDARDRLKQAAQEYGLIEDENAATLQPTTPPYNGPLFER